MMKRDDLEHDLVPIGTVVERLRPDYPDVSHSSLRFLEREGLITPTRTPGGHRLYSPADLQRVRQIKDWQAQRLSLEEIHRRLSDLTSVGSPPDLAGTFLERALAGDLPAARRVILNADELGLPLAVSFIEILRPALWELGDKWERDEVSVAQEKEVSEVARELISELTLRHAAADAGRTGSVVAACVTGETHELGLRMISGLLRARGVGVHFLGGDVAPTFLIDAVQRRRPGAVLLSVTGDDHLTAVSLIARSLGDADHSPRLLVGGQAVTRYPDAITSFGAVPATDDVGELVEALATRDEA